MPDLRIGTRLLAGFGIIVLLTIFLGIYALQKHAALQVLNEQMDSRDFGALDALLQIHRAEEQMRAVREQALLNAVLRRQGMSSGAPEDMERQWLQSRDQIAKQLDSTEATVARYQASATTDQRAAAWGKIRAATHEASDALKRLSPEVEQQFGLIHSGDIPGAVVRNGPVEAASVELAARMDAARQAAEEQRQLGRVEAANLAKETRDSVILVLATIAVAGTLLAMLIQRSITLPLRQFAEIAERVGQGDLTQEADVVRRDELGDLGRSLARMVRGLKQVAEQARRAADKLSAATEDILASTQQQAASTAQQAAAVQQANATMAQITRSGSQISDRAKQVAASAEATTSASAAGLESVQNTAAIMESIREQAEAVAENVIALSEKTQAVGEIITTVNDIAEQSHLLALNAAIQAAVAGEHGRSFSVVATEIKNLAAQSKQATVQVRSILGDIQKAITSSVMLTEEAVKRVESGRQQADVADRTIRQLTGNIEESVRTFQQIVGGSAQQQIGFEQVTEAFRNIGVATQQTAASTRQSEKAAANLSELAQQLIKAVERYRI